MPPSAAETDLVVFAPARWSALRQRPQHLVERLAARRARGGGRTWYVEPPESAAVIAPRLVIEEVGPVTRIRLEVGPLGGGGAAAGFAASGYGPLLGALLRGRDAPRDAWLGTPAALDLAIGLRPRVLLYDVTEEHGAAGDGAGIAALAHRRALAEAHLVTTAGRTLHRGVLSHRSSGVHFLPGGVDHDHFATAARRRPDRDHVVAGYVGPVDGRLDLALLAALADGLPDWRIVLVGPIASDDRDRLPRRANLEYLGDVPYEALPGTLATFDVALLPYALTSATRALSPTVALEYLAAGLPVVSTRLADVVVTELTGVVHFADDAEGFARECSQAVLATIDLRDRTLAAQRPARGWDSVADELARLLDDTAARVGGPRPGTDHESATTPQRRRPAASAAAAAAAAWRGVTGGPAGRGLRG